MIGICYGFQVNLSLKFEEKKNIFQLINKHFDGNVGLQPRREDGRTKIKVIPNNNKQQKI